MVYFPALSRYSHAKSTDLVNSMADSSEAKSWAIVGASRGLGHEFANQLLSKGHQVIATVRRPTLSPQAESLFGTNASCHIYECDVLSESSIDAFATKLSHDGIKRLDYLVLNAGVLKYPNVSSVLPS